MANIYPINKAPRISITVEADGEIVYNGDSSFEANDIYKKLSQQNRRPKLTKEIKRPTEEWSKSIDMKNKIALYDAIEGLPEKIKDVYSYMIIGLEVPPEKLAAAIQYHPEYFQPV